MKKLISKKITVKGKVQGIGFRWFVRDLAEELGVLGYVKNNIDGTVDIVVEVEDEKILEKFIQRVKTEHPYAVITDINVEEIQPNYYKNFFIKF